MPRGPKGEHRPPDVIGNAVEVMRGFLFGLQLRWPRNPYPN